MKRERELQGHGHPEKRERFSRTHHFNLRMSNGHLTVGGQLSRIRKKMADESPDRALRRAGTPCFGHHAVGLKGLCQVDFGYTASAANEFD